METTPNLEITKIAEGIKAANEDKQNNLNKLAELKKLIDETEALYTEVQTSEGTDKPFYKSKGFWGGLVAVGGSVAALFGVNVDVTSLQSIVDNVFKLAPGIIGSLGGLLAIVGRKDASGKLIFPWSK